MGSSRAPLGGELVAALAWASTIALAFGCASSSVSSDAGATSSASSAAGIATSSSTASAAAAASSAPAGMAIVPAGSFTMGADRGGEPDEHPAHRVTLGAFWLDLTEVTNEAWSICVDAGRCPGVDAESARKNGFGSDRPFRAPNQPVTAITWDAARGYCAFVGKRLPTEAEWEHAARGDDARTFPWGNSAPSSRRAVFGGKLSAAVGTHPEGDGPYGHHDLAGNVWEWVEDVYDPIAYTRPGAANGKGGTCDEALEALDDLRKRGKKGFTGANPIPRECERVLRGGAFNYPGFGIRASNRVHHPARFHLVMAGFRCAKDPS